MEACKMSYFTTYETDSSRQSKNAECIYSEVQRLYFKCRSKEERQRDALVTVELLKGVSPVSEKSLSLKLTDDEDPFFFFSLLITENDFKTLKTQQGLLIDFVNFPSQLVMLLQMCKGGKENPNPKFLLILDENDTDSVLDGMRTCLQIVEKNQFKHLCHLSLHIGGGSDEDIKMYMASKIKHLTETVSKSRTQLHQTEAKLSDISSELQTKCIDLEEMKKQWSVDKNLLEKQNLQELKAEREHFANVQLDWQQKLERIKKEDEGRHLEIVKHLESQLTDLKAEYQRNFEKLCEANSLIRELKDKIAGMERELSVFKKDISAIQRQNSKLDEDYHEKARAVNHLRSEKAALEQELREKSNLINKQQDQISNLTDRKEQLKEKLDEKEASLQKKNVNIEALSNDLLKANEILAKLQSEQSEISSKLKLRTSITIEQEKLLEKKQKEFSIMQRYVRDLETESQSFKGTEKQLQESLAVANAKLEEKEKIVKNNENVINWLNRKLTEAHFKTIQAPIQDYKNPLLTSTPYSEIAARFPVSAHMQQNQSFPAKTGYPPVDQTAPRSAPSWSVAPPQPIPALHTAVDPKMMQPYIPAKERVLLDNQRHVPVSAQEMPVLAIPSHSKQTGTQISGSGIPRVSKQTVLQVPNPTVPQVPTTAVQQLAKPKSKAQKVTKNQAPMSAYFSKPSQL